MRRSPRWLRWLVIAGIAWALAALGISLVSDRSPRNLTLVISIAASGAYTLLLFATRRAWLPWLARRPVAGATALGIFNAALIEALFLAVQTALGADGVAAHTDLFMDWLLTMPWYAGMVWIFVRVQRRERYSAAAVLLWGAAYEAGADGTVGGLIVPAIMGTLADPLVSTSCSSSGWRSGSSSPCTARWSWRPPGCSMRPQTPRRTGRFTPGDGFAPGLTPFAWLAIYTVYLLGVMVVMGFLNR